MTPKQTLFVAEYLKTGNGTRAYQFAYGVADKNTARANAARTLAKASIKAAVEEAQQQIMEQTSVTIASVVERINRLADTAEKDSDRHKALDLLCRHLGAYITPAEIIDKLSDEALEQLAQKIIDKSRSHEQTNQ